MRSVVLVRDIMSRRPKTVPADAPISDAFEELLAGSFRLLPVVEHGRVVGMVSDRDLLSHFPPAPNGPDLETRARMASAPVRDIMVGPAMSVAEEEALEVAVELLLVNQLSGLVVTDSQERPVGMLTLVDVARAFLQDLRVGSVS